MSATSESYYMHGLTFCRMVKTQFLSKVMSLVYLITNVNETRETRLEIISRYREFYFSRSRISGSWTACYLYDRLTTVDR